MQLTLPDEDIRTTGMSESELKLELAVLLYAQRRVTMVSGSHIAGLSFVDFQREVANRGVTVNYDLEEFERDLETLRSWHEQERVNS